MREQKSVSDFLTRTIGQQLLSTMPQSPCLLAMWQNDVARNDVAQGCAGEDIGWEMCLERESGKTNGSRPAVSYPRHPAMPTVSLAEDCRDRECRESVPGWKTTGTKVKGPFVASEPRIVEFTVLWDRSRRDSAAYISCYERWDAGIDESFGCENRCLLPVRVVAHQADHIRRSRDDGHSNDSVLEA